MSYRDRIPYTYSRMLCPSMEERELADRLTLETLTPDTPIPVVCRWFNHHPQANEIRRTPQFVAWAKANAEAMGLGKSERRSDGE